MKTTNPREITVVGAGLTGLTAAVLLARSGHQVTVLDRDPQGAPPGNEQAWEHWARPGVSQFRQPHLMLPRWHQQMLSEFPELAVGLPAAGARRVNMLHLQSAAAVGGWQDGDEAFDTLTARRPVLEAALCALLVRGQRRLRIRRGVGVRDLLVERSGAVPRVLGVRTTAGEIRSDLVVDAAGRHTRLPRWAAQAGADPAVDSEDSGFIYYGRHFRSRDGRAPQGANPVLSHFPSLSVLTLPCDAGTYCLVLVAASRDRALRDLRHEPQWLAAVAANPVASRWAAQGDPITPVMPIAGIKDVRRSYVRDGEPTVLGLLPVGDSSAATNPSLGRGAAIGAIQASVLRNVLAEEPGDARELALAYERSCAQSVTPWVEGALRFDRHRLAEMQADADGVPYAPGDPSWAMTTALLRVAASDPVLARASSRIGAMLATPPEIFADPAVQQRIGPYLSAPRYPAQAPSRKELLQVLCGARDSLETPAQRAS